MIQTLPELKTETTNKNMIDDNLKKRFPTYSPHDVLRVEFYFFVKTYSQGLPWRSTGLESAFQHG